MVPISRQLLICIVLFGCAGPETQCKELSRDELYAIVNRELGRSADAQTTKNSKITIKRAGCDYLYLEEDVPENAGGWFAVNISQDGEVIEFIPGL